MTLMVLWRVSLLVLDLDPYSENRSLTDPRTPIKVKVLSSGPSGGRLAAQAPRHISIMTQKVGLKICRMYGVSW